MGTMDTKQSVCPVGQSNWATRDTVPPDIDPGGSSVHTEPFGVVQFCHPLKTAPAANGYAVRVCGTPIGSVAEHVLPQLIPAPVTVPLAVPDVLTFRV
jgi:hypothetical protein